MRVVHYDQGDVLTLDVKGIPAPLNAVATILDPSGADEGETAEGTTNKSNNVDEDAMGLECDGQNCYPKFF